jgi:phosphoglycolate phosphatase
MNRTSENLIVFDWNGTMLADSAACLRAANVVLGHLGVPHATMAQYRQHYTMPIRNLYEALGAKPHDLETRLSEITPLFHDTYGAATIRLRRGARDMLNHLKMTECDAMILSNYVTHRIDAQATKLGVRAHFSHIIAFEVGDATFRTKGKGGRLKEWLQTRKPKRALIVGDSEEEVEIGREVGMTTVAITDGMVSTARLRAAKPDYLIRSLTEIPAIAQKLFGTQSEARAS